ncbi:hypothetical protein DHL47_08590 [Streptococcus panodentis]|uniref:Uncharacterized protein n=1 Tax=Streptococcus panodentis TaxID=1581472 RepID=A0ABS5AXR6_9STRE|nr:hypothetical protein [Streptococcus panodentis]
MTCSFNICAKAIENYLKIKIFFKKTCKMLSYLIKFDCQSIFQGGVEFGFPISKRLFNFDF